VKYWGYSEKKTSLCIHIKGHPPCAPLKGGIAGCAYNKGELLAVHPLTLKASF